MDEGRRIKARFAGSGMCTIDNCRGCRVCSRVLADNKNRCMILFYTMQTKHLMSSESTCCSSIPLLQKLLPRIVDVVASRT